MLRSSAMVLLAAALLATVLACPAFSQATLPLPDASVKGLGTIIVHRDNVGMFDISVMRAGSTLLGGFHYREFGPSSTRPVCEIQSRQIVDLQVRGNFATIKAIGTWNGMLSDLRIEALDDNPSGDWFHITAWPRSPLTVLYDAAGGVHKGDIAVYSAPVQNGYAKGEGAIAIDRNIGRFRFTAEWIWGVPRGFASFMEIDPTSSAARPKVSIALPAVEKLAILGNTAIFAGRGAMNGRPALIEIRATDNSRWFGPALRPDEFYIRAVTLVADTITPAVYERRGPLVAGDIVVVATR